MSQNWVPLLNENYHKTLILLGIRHKVKQLAGGLATW